MREIREYIRSGILESYVLGLTTTSETKEVEQMAALHVAVGEAIDEFSKMLEVQVMSNAVAPDPIIKPMVMATINYIERLERGEPVSFPPLLNKDSKIADYNEWLIRDDLLRPEGQQEIYARIIGYTPQVTTAIAWINEISPEEVHTTEIEKFLIVEGTCQIIVEKEIHELFPGDYFSIPLFKSHIVKVTSPTPCKVILQRVAA